MKTTVVPAQITTVEDRIAGNLTFTQLILLVMPLITSAAIYLLLSPSNHFNTLKGVLIGLQFLVFGILAIRFRGKVVLDWIIVLIRFNKRPRLYLFNKNDLTARVSEEILIINKKTITKRYSRKRKPKKEISLEDQAKIDRLLDNQSLKFRFDLKKGGIGVSIITNED